MVVAECHGQDGTILTRPAGEHPLTDGPAMRTAVKEDAVIAAHYLVCKWACGFAMLAVGGMLP